MIEGRLQVDSRSIQGQFGIDWGSIRGRFGVDSGPIRGRFGVDSDSIRDRFGGDSRSIVFCDAPPHTGFSTLPQVIPTSIPIPIVQKMCFLFLVVTLSEGHFPVLVKERSSTEVLEHFSA